MIVGDLRTCHTQNTSDSSICIFHLTEQHSQFLLHNLQVLYMCTVCNSTNINTIIQFVSNCLQHVSSDGFNGGSDSYLQFRDTCGKRGNINLILDVTPQKEITWGCIWRTRWQVVKTLTIISNNSVYLRGLLPLDYLFKKGKVQPCTGTEVLQIQLYCTGNEALYRPYCQQGEQKYSCTVQALRLCTGRTAHRGSRAIALLYRHGGSTQAVRPISGVEVQLYCLLTTALEGGEGSASRPGCSLPPEKTR